MFNLLFGVVGQSIPFLPLSLAIYISYNLLKATDMTLDGSFVAGAGVFAHLIIIGIPPLVAVIAAIGTGITTGIMVATFQRKQRIDALLAGILASFILTGLNLILMGMPNINLLNEKTLLSSAFSVSEEYGYFIASIFCGAICLAVILLLKSRFGLYLRAFGDNAAQLSRYGFNIEKYRIFGFALTNGLAASAGCLTAQTIGYADISMGFGLTLTGLGAIILGQEIFIKILHRTYLRPILEFMACVIGVLVYFGAINMLLFFQVDPIYLKIILGIVLVFFLRANSKRVSVQER